MTSRSNSDSSYDNLIKRALRLVGRSSSREQALAEAVAATELARDDAQRQASIGSAGDAVPPQISQVMRAPKGTDRLVVVYHEGMVIKALLHPRGRRNLEREEAVWRCLRDTAIRERRRAHE